jgi:uncharacterized protein (DUF488 family)
MTIPADVFPVHTIGHSTRPLDEFVGLLQAAKVRCLVDVRSIPRSRTNPQYNLDSLPDALAQFQLRHTIIHELGGRRPLQRAVDPDVNGYWNNQSFHNYADYAMSEEFRQGVERLKALHLATPCAIMCSEAVWWRCHRRIIADYILTDGWPVVHIMAPGKLEPAKVTPAAIRQKAVLSYPDEPHGCASEAAPGER